MTNIYKINRHGTSTYQTNRHNINTYARQLDIIQQNRHQTNIHILTLLQIYYIYVFTFFCIQLWILWTYHHRVLWTWYIYIIYVKTSEGRRWRICRKFSYLVLCARDSFPVDFPRSKALIWIKRRGGSGKIHGTERKICYQFCVWSGPFSAWGCFPSLVSIGRDVPGGARAATCKFSREFSTSFPSAFRDRSM